MSVNDCYVGKGGFISAEVSLSRVVHQSQLSRVKESLSILAKFHLQGEDRYPYLETESLKCFLFEIFLS